MKLQSTLFALLIATPGLSACGAEGEIGTAADQPSVASGPNSPQSTTPPPSSIPGSADDDQAPPPSADPAPGDTNADDGTSQPSAQPVTLTVLATPTSAGTVTTTPAAASYPPGTRVTLTATPAVGYRLAEWQGGVGGDGNPLTITLVTHTVVTAVFEPVPVALAIVVEPRGAGNVSAAPAGPYGYGDEVVLQASGNVGYRFAAFSGAATGTSPELALTLTADTTLTARFDRVPVVTGPGTVVGGAPFTLTISYQWGSALASSSDRLELEESTSSANAGFAVIDRSDPGDRPSLATATLTRDVGIYYYRVRAYTAAGSSPYSDVISVKREPGLKRVRIVNDLPGGASGGFDWSQLNQIARVRIGATESQVRSTPSLDRLSTVETTCNVMQMVTIPPGANRELDTAAMPTSYVVYLEAGFWGLWNNCWARQSTMVTNCFGQCCNLKNAVVFVSNHGYDTLDIPVSQFLPRYTWTGTSFCQ